LQSAGTGGDIQFIDTPRHKIRRVTLEILSIINYPNDKKNLPLDGIIDL
jgi:hypothetical protein